MEIDQAKNIHHIVMKVLMHTQGIGEITEADVIAAKEFSLIEMSQANSLMEGYKEGSDKSGFKVKLTTSDTAIAEFYLRLNDDEFLVASEFEEIITAMDEAFEDTENGHGIIINADGYYQLVELTQSGDSSERTLVTVHSPREIYDFVKNRISEIQRSF